MPVAFKAVSATANSTAGNFSFVQPSGVVQGDLIIAFVASKGDTFTFPTGWTSLLATAGSASNGGLHMAYIVRGASAPALTVSARANADICFYYTAAFTGFDALNPVSLASSATNTSPVNTIGTITVADGDMVVLAFGGSDNIAFSTYTDATGQITTWTERSDAGTTNGSNTQLAFATGAVTSGIANPGPFQATGGGAGSSTIGVLRIRAGSNGNLTVTETGPDTLASTGTVGVSGSLTVTEGTVDTFASTGTSGGAVTGNLTVTETGSDTFSSSGVVVVTGNLTATETGSDTFASTGVVVVAGSLSVTESGSDTFAGTGTATGTTTNVSTSYSATGSVTLTRGLVSTRSFGYTATGSFTVTSLKVLIQNFAYSAIGTLTRTRIISRAFAFAATGIETVVKQVSKFFNISGIGTLAYSDLVSFGKELLSTALGVVTFAKTFIGGGGGTVSTLLRRGKTIMLKFGRW